MTKVLDGLPAAGFALSPPVYFKWYDPELSIHKLVEKITQRRDDQDFVVLLLQRLDRGPTVIEQPVILDNLHRFESFRPLVASRLSRYLMRCFRSSRNKSHCWRVFRALGKIEVVNQWAVAAAMVARHCHYRRLRWAARDYLQFCAAKSGGL